MLGVSERTFRRWRDRLRDKGPEGLRDRRIGKPSSRRAAAEEQLGIRDIAAYSPRAAQPLRARLPHLAGSATQGAGLAGSQRRLRGGPGRGQQRLRRRSQRPGVRPPVRPGGTPGGQRQHHQMAGPEPANPAKPAQAAFCARHGAHARLPRRAPHNLSRSASAGRLRSCRKPVRRHQTGCVSRFGSQPVDLWTTQRVAYNPQAQPPQKRSIDPPQRPVNFTRQLHPRHPKSASPKIRVTQNARHPKCASPKGGRSLSAPCLP